MSGFKLKCWRVSVGGWGDSPYVAPTRGRALADAWRCDAFGSMTFGAFLRIARCRRAANPPRFGDPITVGGKPAFYVSHDQQYVQFARPEGEFYLNSHPLDVEPEEYRPSTYRGRSAA